MGKFRNGCQFPKALFLSAALPHSHFRHSATMSSAKLLADIFSTHSVPHNVQSHAPITDLPSWISTITNLNALATKTLILRPKGGNVKGEQYVMALALASTEFSTGAVAKSAGAKEGRVIGEDVAEKVFGLGRKDGIESVHLILRESTVLAHKINGLIQSPHFTLLLFKTNLSSHSSSTAHSSLSPTTSPSVSARPLMIRA